MAWFDLLREIEPFDELPFDRALVEALEAAAHGATAWRVTVLHPDLPFLCQRRIERLRQGELSGFLYYRRSLRAQLRPLPGQNPRTDDRGDKPGGARTQGAGSRPAQGFARLPAFRRLQSPNEVPYERYYPTIEKLKREFPYCASPHIRPCSTNGAPSAWRRPASMWP